MQKIKTHRGAKKRFKITAKGKILRRKAFKSHILTKKSTKRKRNLKKITQASKSDKTEIKKMLPYEF
ncbi:MAG: 50S ribosomal protein L35 [Acidobacteriota bacterium]